jgi:hypothetical protein
VASFLTFILAQCIAGMEKRQDCKARYRCDRIFFYGY